VENCVKDLKIGGTEAHLSKNQFKDNSKKETQAMNDKITQSMTK